MRGRSNRETSQEFSCKVTKRQAMLDITKECKSGDFSRNYVFRESEILQMYKYPELIEYIII